MEHQRLPSIRDFDASISSLLNQDSNTGRQHQPAQASSTTDFHRSRSVSSGLDSVPSTSSVPSSRASNRPMTPPESLPSTPHLHTASINSAMQTLSTSRPSSSGSARTSKKGPGSFPAPGVLSTIFPDMLWSETYCQCGPATSKCECTRLHHKVTECFRRGITKESRFSKNATLFPAGFLPKKPLDTLEKMKLITNLSRTSNKPAQNNGDTSENQWDEIDSRAIIAMMNMLSELGITQEMVWERMRSEETTGELQRGMLAGRSEEPWSFEHFAGTRAEDVARLIAEGLVSLEAPKGAKRKREDEEKKKSEALVAWEANVKKLCLPVSAKL